MTWQNYTRNTSVPKAEDREQKPEEPMSAEQAEAKLALLEKRLPCGHRQFDMADASGGCVFCTYRDGYEVSEARLVAVVEMALRLIG